MAEHSEESKGEGLVIWPPPFRNPMAGWKPQLGFEQRGDKNLTFVKTGSFWLLHSLMSPICKWEKLITSQALKVEMHVKAFTCFLALST